MRREVWLALSALALVPVTARACDDCLTQFPRDSGALNVRDFGARGDGQSDDTHALIAAIAAAGEDTGPAFWRTRVVYLPAGTYRVSQPLVKRYASGRFGSGMVLVGASAATTTIRLSNHAAGFGDPNAPRGVIMTTAKLLDGSPTSGGKDYTHKGEGNDAYENFVENLTIDVGQGNPGAIGIDYLANNIGAIRNVRVLANPDSGAIGIAMQRKWPGPVLLQHVSVRGFATGIAVANTEYGVTLDHVDLAGQREIGLANAGNAVAAADLTVRAHKVAIANTAPGGQIVLVASRLQRADASAVAMRNDGVVVAQGVTLDGFAAPDGARTPLTGVWQGGAWQAKPAAVTPALADAPAAPEEPPGKWLNALHDHVPQAARGQALAASPDITEALRRAFASGAATIYLPYGRYTISDGITVPATVRRIVGMNASITVRPERRPEFARDTGMLQITQPGPPLTIERVVFDMTDLGDQLAVQVSAKRDVTLRDIVTAGASLLQRDAGGGRVFIEDACCGALRLAGPAPVYARQYDTEGGGTRIRNDGAPLTILGLKTEGDNVVLDNRDGARTAILGGLLYIVGDANPKIPAFLNRNASLQASFLEESFRRASRYTVYLRDPATSRSINAAEFPARGDGRNVPWLEATAGRP